MKTRIKPYADLRKLPRGLRNKAGRLMAQAYRSQYGIDPEYSRRTSTFVYECEQGKQINDIVVGL